MAGRELVRGRLGAVSAASPLAVEAGVEVLANGGNAVDAAIAAQAVLTVVMPEACGLGGDALLLVNDGSVVTAINGTGAAAAGATAAAIDGGASVTVPGLPQAWTETSSRWGRLPRSDVLAAAIVLAGHGAAASAATVAAANAQRERLVRGGAGEWAWLTAAPGDLVRQPALAETLSAIAAGGDEAFYTGAYADSIVSAVARTGGDLASTDLAQHATPVLTPISVAWSGQTVHVQPPMSQGVLLALALAAIEDGTFPGATAADLVALIGAVFTHRDDVAEGATLLERPLNAAPAAPGSGPRAYLHTAGVATADQHGMVVSSLVSVFDDFGSAVFVPEGGFVLNNRAGGFTSGRNAFRPGSRPVHTLAPAMTTTGRNTTALATPGADGQVQTLLQVLCRVRDGLALPAAITAPRWRCEDGKVLVEDDHAAIGDLAGHGCDVEILPAGDDRFGAVVCAGVDEDGPFCIADHRRGTACEAT